jgi:hypothetical protein
MLSAVIRPCGQAVRAGALSDATAGEAYPSLAMQVLPRPGLV